MAVKISDVNNVNTEQKIYIKKNSPKARASKAVASRDGVGWVHSKMQPLNWDIQ